LQEQQPLRVEKQNIKKILESSEDYKECQK